MARDSNGTEVVALIGTDANSGNAPVTLGTQLDPINDIITTYPFGHSYTYISTATTTVVKSGAGTLIGIVVNGGTTGTITVYDNTAASGTTPFVFDTTNAIASYRFDVGFSTGCTIVTSAATKITAIWR